MFRYLPIQIDVLYVYYIHDVYGTSNTYILLYTCKTGIPKTYNDIPSLIYYNVVYNVVYMYTMWLASLRLEPT